MRREGVELLASEEGGCRVVSMVVREGVRIKFTKMSSKFTILPIPTLSSSPLSPLTYPSSLGSYSVPVRGEERHETTRVYQQGHREVSNDGG